MGLDPERFFSTLWNLSTRKRLSDPRFFTSLLSYADMYPTVFDKCMPVPPSSSSRCPLSRSQIPPKKLLQQMDFSVDTPHDCRRDTRIPPSSKNHALKLSTRSFTKGIKRISFCACPSRLSRFFPTSSILSSGYPDKPGTIS